MKNRIKGALVAGILAGSMILSAVPAFAEEGAEKYPEFITVDVFDGQANFQGLQSGWFAKIVKDKFNMELNIIAPNVAGGGDTLYQTRSANGDLGDLILMRLDQSYLHDLVEAELVLDLTPYMEDCENLKKYEEMIKQVSTLADEEGMWAVPSQISTLPITEPCEATDPTNAACVRWDLYKEIGSPEIGTLEDLLPVMKEMQEAAGTSTSGKDVYAFSLFADWDGDIMQNAGALPSLYGYDPMGFVLFNIMDGTTQSVIDDESQYVRALRFFFTANQMGLVDPESTTQNFDTVAAKYVDGAVLYSLWPWLGTGQFNNVENMEAGKGFVSIPVADAKYLCWGNTAGGSTSFGCMIGSKAEDPQRMADFIDWLYSPEGIECSGADTGGACGPEGLTWELDEEGVPKLTDFGVKAFVDIVQDLEVPEEWGGGTWKDGISALNFKAVGIKDIDESTGMCYNYALWDDYLERTATKVSAEWAEKYGANTALEAFQNMDILSVVPGVAWSTPDYSTDISVIKEQCKAIIREYSWRMCFAADEEEFESLLDEMQEIAVGLGYDDVLAVDMENAAARWELFQTAFE